MVVTFTAAHALPGFCNHVDIASDNESIWVLVDADPTILLYRRNSPTNTSAWQPVFDLLRDCAAWPRDLKPGLGHSFIVGPNNVHLFIPYIHTVTRQPGIFQISLLKSSLIS